MDRHALLRDPATPAFLDYVTLHQLSLGKPRLDLRLHRHERDVPLNLSADTAARSPCWSDEARRKLRRRNAGGRECSGLTVISPGSGAFLFPKTHARTTV
jgi:hypothetical protein